ncbi:hypothetical protein LXA43DRAFT_998506 [Ganoderma leucocontextum]|nr:hypothetical protein LXA43DRAFT_998506 [Ganoderma leucocontextum]
MESYCDNGTVGPNSLLNDTCAAADNQQGSAISGITRWSAAGMPINQIVLGVASYGHSFHVDPCDAVNDRGTINTYPLFNASVQPCGDEWDDLAGTDVCGNKTGPGGIFTSGAWLIAASSPSGENPHLVRSICSTRAAKLRPFAMKRLQ